MMGDNTGRGAAIDNRNYATNVETIIDNNKYLSNISDINKTNSEKLNMSIGSPSMRNMF
jgi:hypothetical protein